MSAQLQLCRRKTRLDCSCGFKAKKAKRTEPAVAPNGSIDLSRTNDRPSFDFRQGEPQRAECTAKRNTEKPNQGEQATSRRIKGENDADGDSDSDFNGYLRSWDSGRMEKWMYPLDSHRAKSRQLRSITRNSNGGSGVLARLCYELLTYYGANCSLLR